MESVLTLQSLFHSSFIQINTQRADREKSWALRDHVHKDGGTGTSKRPGREETEPVRWNEAFNYKDLQRLALIPPELSHHLAEFHSCRMLRMGWKRISSTES